MQGGVATLYCQKDVDLCPSHPHVLLNISGFVPLWCYNNLHFSGKVFHRILEHACGDFLFSHMSISEIRQRINRARRPGVHSAFQIIPKVFAGVGIRAVCRALREEPHMLLMINCPQTFDPVVYLVCALSLIVSLIRNH